MQTSEALAQRSVRTHTETADPSGTLNAAARRNDIEAPNASLHAVSRKTIQETVQDSTIMTRDELETRYSFGGFRAGLTEFVHNPVGFFKTPPADDLTKMDARVLWRFHKKLDETQKAVKDDDKRAPLDDGRRAKLIRSREQYLTPWIEDPKPQYIKKAPEDHVW